MCCSSLTIDNTPYPATPPLLQPPPTKTFLPAVICHSQLVSVFYQAFKFVDNMLRLIVEIHRPLFSCLSFYLILSSPHSILFLAFFNHSNTVLSLVFVTVEQID